MHLGNIEGLCVYILLSYYYYHCNFTIHCNFPAMFEENTKTSPFFWIGGTSEGDSQKQKKNDFKNTIPWGWIENIPQPMKSRMNTGWTTKWLLSFNMNGFEHQKRWQDIATSTWWFQPSSKNHSQHWKSAHLSGVKLKKNPVLELETTWTWGKLSYRRCIFHDVHWNPTCKRCFIFRIFTEDPSSVR